MTTKPKTPSMTARAKALAEKTEDAYSAGDYRNWSAVCRMLLARGYSEKEAEAILRSKWTRWAGDMVSSNDNLPTKTLADFLDARPKAGRPSMFKSDEDLARQVAELVAETFDANGEVLRSW